MPRNWYAYISGDPLLPGSYRKSTVKPGCLNGEEVCAVSINSSATTPPPLSSNIQQYIVDGLVSTVAQPSTPSDAKKYLYMRNSSE